MGAHVRAKFRCLGITQRYDGNFIMELKPVMKKSGGNYEENKLFWSASPSGDCELCFFSEHPLEVGAYYYIDMVRVEPDQGDMASMDTWTLNSVSSNESGGVEVNLHWYKTYDWQKPKPKGILSGRLKIYMEQTAQGAIEAMKKPGSKWVTTFTFAEPSDS